MRRIRSRNAVLVLFAEPVNAHVVSLVQDCSDCSVDVCSRFILHLSDLGSSTDERGPDEERCIYPEWRDPVEPPAEGRRSPEQDRGMEERKTKALNLLSKLQEDSLRQPNGNKGRSNFEDCEYHLMKKPGTCWFSKYLRSCQ